LLFLSWVSAGGKELLKCIKIFQEFALAITVVEVNALMDPEMMGDIEVTAIFFD